MAMIQTEAALADARPKPAPAEPLAIELAGIDKRFGGVHALRGADLYVRRGEILGLCGENGAGKSTLIKVLSGAYPHDSYAGSVSIFGQEQRFRAPVDAQRAGVAVVHQELMLVPELSVAQNLLLGREPRHLGLLDDAQVEALARRELTRFGFADRIDAARRVGELGIGLQQAVEIIRALSQNAKILILDEPTAALSAQETQELLRWLKRLRSEGTTSIYVSHRLDEVFAICDRIAVLRDGRHVATVDAKKSEPDEVVSLMVGRTVRAPERRARQENDRAPVLELRDFGVLRPRLAGETRAAYAVQGVSLCVRPGEIVAVCGAVGSGRTALLSSIFGCAKAGTSGELHVGGERATIVTPADAIARGLAFVPEDRKGAGLVLGMSVAENLALPSLDSAKLMGRRHAALGLVDASAEAKLAERSIKSLRIRGDANAAVSTLSGGNQQKVVLGKWLDEPPRVLLLDEPTRGVDVGAREEIYGILERLAEQGIAVLFSSSDLTEVMRLAHRVIVLRQGRVSGEFAIDAIDENEIVRLSTGANAEVSDIQAAEKS